MQRYFLFFFFLPNLCCLSKCKVVQQPTGMVFFAWNRVWIAWFGVKFAVEKPPLTELADCVGWRKGEALQSHLCCLPGAIPPVCHPRGCAQALPCHARLHGIDLAAHLQFISMDDHQPSQFPGPTMSISTIRATEVSWCLFKHQEWNLGVQQNVPPVCPPSMLLTTGREDLGGLTGQPWPRHVVMPLPSSIRAISSPVCTKTGCPCPGPGPPHCLLFPGLCVRLFCHLSVAAAACS